MEDKVAQEYSPKTMVTRKYNVFSKNTWLCVTLPDRMADPLTDTCGIWSFTKAIVIQPNKEFCILNDG